MKQAAIYARVSTDKQQEQRTIESQLAELREVCRAQEVEVVGEYIDDGVSGTTLARPGLDRLRDDASKGLFHTVYILSPDRLARKYVYQALVLEDLRKQGIQVVFLDKEVTDKPEDQLLLGMQGLIAEYERAQIMERTRRGKLHRVRNGELVGGAVPYGYNYISRSEAEGAHLEINPQETEVVRLIFSLYLHGQHSIGGVARELIRRGIRTRKGLRHWRTSVVHRILQNECYVGRAFFNKYQHQRPGTRRRRDESEWVPIKAPAIIDPETFRLTQEVLKSRRRTARSAARLYILSGLLRCRYCGSTYTGFSNSNECRYFYYRCNNAALRQPLPRTCKARAVRAERIENAVIQEVKAAVLKPEVLQSHVMRLARDATENATELHRARANLLNQHQVMVQKKERLLDLYLERALSQSEYLERKAAMDENLKNLEEKLQEAAQGIPAPDAPTIARSASQFSQLARARLEMSEPEGLRAFLRLLCEAMTYDWQERRVILRGHIPVMQVDDRISSPVPGVRTPGISGKTLSFELEVKV